jgi:hypothetical protein
MQRGKWQRPVADAIPEYRTAGMVASGPEFDNPVEIFASPAKS